ncbi:SusC/RagA family TonB-linked outer membrane protein [Elizabethkingia sp. JS20170427COW]|uniref:SusC/RagA family TonB-linked outer membrane protein n=1 Tax=Elizabethkingia sp. JS20170427COW TaxID=2583851 RepID=UPI00111097B6|nr:SusC/RagA family TonB-linked outer membrane protein [Elizabethkingia sp. JS20170427COW]QCX54264.1 SusC/RagA family TonB-linked outer membrane protein [Elizabethkingia sp. JS20170427COW]
MKKSVNCILAVVLSSSFSLAFAQNTTDSTKTKQKEIEEVVVTGYRKQDRRTLTTSISKLDTKVLESAPRSNVATALAGAVPGVRVNMTTGQPGATPQITVRGGTDWGGSGSPLVLIDGVPGSFFGLNSNDVESMEVLKDAAATAIYGAQGANGVVLVTTKRGKKGRSSINFSSKTTFNFLPKTLEYMGAADFVKFNRMAVKNYSNQMNSNNFDSFINGIFPAGTGNNTTNSVYTTMILTDQNKYLLNQPGWMSIDDPITPGQKLIFMDNDMSQLYYQPSLTQDYNISVNGGTEKSTYYASLGYLDDMGIVYGSRMKRISGVVNASFQIKDNFKVSTNTSYIMSNYIPHFLNNDYDLFQRAAGLAPTTRIYYNNPDGSLSSELNPGVDVNFGNPLYYNDKFIRKNMEQRFSTAVQADWGFAKNFNLTVRGSFRTIVNDNEAFAKRYISGGKVIDSRISSFATSRDLTPQMTSFITYKNDWGKHHFDALVGHEYKYNNYFSNSSATKGSPTDLIYTMNAGAESSGVPTSSRTRYALNSYYSQMTYNYDNKYLFGFNARIDGSSRLFEENQYDFFPGVSVGWNMHREEFFKPITKVVSTFKPRVSYGVNGNVETLGNFTAFGLYGATGTYDSQTGYVNTSLPNQNLVWERMKSWNYGLDLGLFNNRVNLTAEYYTRIIDRKLSNLELPSWAGLGSILQNVGTMKTKGWEFGLNANIIRKHDLQWNLSANYTSYKSYAVKLPDNGIENNRIGGTQIYDASTGQLIYVGGRQEGQRVGLDLITAYVFDGVYKTQAELDADKNLEVSFSRQPLVRHLGDTKWKDINGDGIINYKDRVVVGRITPKFMGGLSTDLTYKNFSLAVRTDFAVGHYKINGVRVKGMAQTQGSQNGPVEITQSWTPSNPNSNIPSYTFTDPMKNHLAAGSDQGDMSNSSTYFWEKGDYLALREITLGYNFKGEMFNNIIQNMRIFVTGANLYYFTNYSGNNPEYNGNGSDTGTFPIPRTFTVGIDLTF